MNIFSEKFTTDTLKNKMLTRSIRKTKSANNQRTPQQRETYQRRGILLKYINNWLYANCDCLMWQDGKLDKYSDCLHQVEQLIILYGKQGKFEQIFSENFLLGNKNAMDEFYGEIFWLIYEYRFLTHFGSSGHKFRMKIVRPMYEGVIQSIPRLQQFRDNIQQVESLIQQFGDLHL